MVKSTHSYWEKRILQIEEKMERYGNKYLSDLTRLYKKTSRQTQSLIGELYDRLDEDKLKEARKPLTKNELRDFRETLTQYSDYARSHGNTAWADKLDNMRRKRKLTRLVAMGVHIENFVDTLMGTELDGITELMREIYTESYYRIGHALQTGLGIGYAFARLDDKAVEMILHKPWVSDGSNFSERIWGKHRPQLINELHRGLTTALATGQPTTKLEQTIAERFGVARSRAENLVRTERAFFSNVAMQKQYEQLGVDYQQFCATLDLRTSEMCREADGSIVATKDIQIGVNAPPLHCRCRSVMIPYFEDTKDERIAKDKDGKTIYVDGKMTYDEWYKKFIEGEN